MATLIPLCRNNTFLLLLLYLFVNWKYLTPNVRVKSKDYSLLLWPRKVSTAINKVDCLLFSRHFHPISTTHKNWQFASVRPAKWHLRNIAFSSITWRTNFQSTDCPVSLVRIWGDPYINGNAFIYNTYHGVWH